MPPEVTSRADSTPRRIVIVIGPGRSGTSTVAGAIAQSGYEVPGQAIRGNKTNPSGFFEPRWVVDFQRDLLRKHHVGLMDASPGAFEVTRRVCAEPEVRGTLREWLSERLDEQPRIVVKDPRTIWFSGLWVDVARELGVEPCFVTMLRHPAEVSASRQTYYGHTDRANARADEIRRIAGWVNVALQAEEVTAGSPRVLVRYTDLVADWRAVFGRFESVLGLELDPPASTRPHPVDEFIDPTLHRVRVQWEDVDVPAALRDVAEEAWQVLSRVAVEGDTPAATEAVARVRADYAQLSEDALALHRQTMKRLEATAARRARRQLRRELGPAPRRAEPRAAATTAARLWQRVARRQA